MCTGPGICFTRGFGEVSSSVLLCQAEGNFPLLLLIAFSDITEILIAFVVIGLVLSFLLTGKTILGRMKGIACIKAFVLG